MRTTWWKGNWTDRWCAKLITNTFRLLLLLLKKRYLRIFIALSFLHFSLINDCLIFALLLLLLTGRSIASLFALYFSLSLSRHRADIKISFTSLRFETPAWNLWIIQQLFFCSEYFSAHFALLNLRSLLLAGLLLLCTKSIYWYILVAANENSTICSLRQSEREREKAKAIIFDIHGTPIEVILVFFFGNSFENVSTGFSHQFAKISVNHVKDFIWMS